jgi:hypothetical protein
LVYAPPSKYWWAHLGLWDLWELLGS